MAIPELPEDLKLAARTELNEPEPPQQRAVLELLRSRLESLQNDNPNKPDRLDDVYLIRFLRHAKWSEDRAYEKITNMAKFKHEHADLLDNITAEEFRPLAETGMMQNLPGKTKVGARMSTLDPNGMLRYEGDKNEFWKLNLRYSFFNLQRLADDPYLQVHGLCIIETFEKFSFFAANKLNTKEAKYYQKLSFKFMQECAPFRINSIYVTHQPWFISFLFAIVRPFMKAKLFKRIRLFGSHIDQLHQLIDPVDLPPLFGGTLQDKPTDWLELQINADKEGKKVTGYTP